MGGRLHGDDEGGGLGLAGAAVAVGGAGVEVDGVPGFEFVEGVGVANFERAFEQVKEFVAGVDVGADVNALFQRDELGKVGIDAAIGDHVAEVLEEVGGLFDAGLRQANAVGLAMNAEQAVRFGLEEVGEVFAEDHGDAREIAQGGDDAAGLELGEEAGGEAGVAAEFDQAHGLFEAEALDALADFLFNDDGFGGAGVNLPGGDLWLGGGSGAGGGHGGFFLEVKSGQDGSRDGQVFNWHQQLCYPHEQEFGWKSEEIGWMGLEHWEENGSRGGADCQARRSCKTRQGRGFDRLERMQRRKTGGFWRVGAAGMSLLAACGLAGCGMPGPPQPPSLQLAKQVGDLAAERVGPVVELRWTGPEENTDKTKVKPGGKTVVCRKDSASGSCLPVGSVANQPGGALTFEDALPEGLRTGEARALEYAVSVENVRGRSAGWSDPALTAAGVAPGDVVGLTATLTARGVWLRWQEKNAAAGTAVTWRIERRLVAGAAKTADEEGKGRDTKERGLGGPEKEFVERTLEVEGTDAASGEVLDKHITWNAKYAYRVQAVRKLKVETASASSKTEMEMHGTEILGRRSEEVEVATKKVFAPAAPVGLAGVPGWDAAGDKKGPRVDLSWSPNDEADVAGYRVFRAEGPDAIGAVVSGAELVVGSAFTDQTAKPGTKYRYWVVAVDASGNVSAASDAIEVETLASGS
jgi:hypothetical protein